MSEPIPSATVVLLKTVERHLEVLLLKRNSKISYGGAWVFPGGKMDAADYSEGMGNGDLRDPHCKVMLAAAKNAAYRETQEEAGLSVAHEELLFFSHWITPKIRPKRFSTWFFMVPTKEHVVTIDGEEIHEHCWRSPADALRAHKKGEIELVPPTYLTLLELSRYATVDAVMNAYRSRSPVFFEPRVEMLPDGLCYMYAGDAGYEHTDRSAEGSRHRLTAKHNLDWVYERTEQ